MFYSWKQVFLGLTAALFVATSCSGQGTETTPATGKPAAESSRVKTAQIKTSMGLIVVELDADKAPGTVDNFVRYANEKFYDGTIFHRVIGNFMIQGGGFDERMNEKPTSHPSIKNEAANGLHNVRGTIAMARTPDPHSANAQFFINVVDNPFLDYRSPDSRGYGYAVFGHVITGMDVVDRIKAVATTTVKGHEGVPTEPVMIESIRIVDGQPPKKNP